MALSKRRQKSVYPDPCIYGVIGHATADMNFILEGATHLLARANVEIEDRFTPDEWQFLAAVVKGAVADPTTHHGRWLAERIDASGYYANTQIAWSSIKIPDIKRKLRELSDIEALSLLMVLRQFWRYRIAWKTNAVNDQWWRLEYRLNMRVDMLEYVRTGKLREIDESDDSKDEF